MIMLLIGSNSWKETNGKLYSNLELLYDSAKQRAKLPHCVIKFNYDNLTVSQHLDNNQISTSF